GGRPGRPGGVAAGSSSRLRRERGPESRAPRQRPRSWPDTPRDPRPIGPMTRTGDRYRGSTPRTGLGALLATPPRRVPDPRRARPEAARTGGESLGLLVNRLADDGGHRNAAF